MGNKFPPIMAGEALGILPKAQKLNVDLPPEPAKEPVVAMPDPEDIVAKKKSQASALRKRASGRTSTILSAASEELG